MTKFLKELAAYIASGKISDIDSKFPEFNKRTENLRGKCSKRVKQLISFVEKLKGDLDSCHSAFKNMDPEKQKQKHWEHIEKMYMLSEEIEVARGLLSLAISEKVRRKFFTPNLQLRKGWRIVSVRKTKAAKNPKCHLTIIVSPS